MWDYYFRLSRSLTQYSVGTIPVIPENFDINEFDNELDLFIALRTPPIINNLIADNSTETNFLATADFSYFANWNINFTPPTYNGSATIAQVKSVYQNNNSLSIAVYKYQISSNNTISIVVNGVIINSLDTAILSARTEGKLLDYPERNNVNYQAGLVGNLIFISRSFGSHVWNEVVAVYRRELRLKPCYFDLVTGFRLDSRVIPDKITLTANENKYIRLGYYRNNPDEKYKHDDKTPLKSIDWIDDYIELKANAPKEIDVAGIVLGTLDLNNSVAISPLPNSRYPAKYLKNNHADIAELFAYWNQLYSASNNNSGNGYELKLIAATNNYWNNATIDSDIGYDANHPLFKLDNTRTYDYYFKPQNDGSFGDLTMDSPRVIEIHDRIQKIIKAFDVEQYHKMPDSDAMRIWNLGKIIHEIARVLGLRREADGTIDYRKEKDRYQRKTLNAPKYNAQEYSQNQFGSYGLVVPHLPTSYDERGRLLENYDIVYDIPQLLQALHEQIDKSLSIQHGSEIRVRNIEDRISKYPNQLALTIDLFRKIEAIELYSQRSYNMSMIQGAEIRGLYGGIGIPVTQKFIDVKPLRGNGKGNRKLPYFDFQKGQASTLDHIQTIFINLAILVGAAMPRKQDKKSRLLNPFKFFARNNTPPSE